MQYGALESVMYSVCDAVGEQAGVASTTEEAAVGEGTRCVRATHYQLSTHCGATFVRVFILRFHVMLLV